MNTFFVFFEFIWSGLLIEFLCSIRGRQENMTRTENSIVSQYLLINFEYYIQFEEIYTYG